MVSTARKAEPDIRVDHVRLTATGNTIAKRADHEIQNTITIGTEFRVDAEIPSMPPRIHTTMPTREIVIWTPTRIVEMAISQVLRALTVPWRRSNAATPKLHVDAAE